jgi:glycosyltransferase involved in cell wall biosynthesis
MQEATPAGATQRERAGIVVPAYNGAATLRRALDSIAAAAGRLRHDLADPPDVVLAVVDDASADDTVALAQAFAADAAVETLVLCNPQNRGTSASRNRGAAACGADYLFFLDQDDEFLPDHLAACIDALRRHPDRAFVRAGVELTDPVHPFWQTSIEDTLVLNTCVRGPCHAFLGGFHEVPEVRVLRAEDALYSDLLHRFFRGIRLTRTTMRHYRMPGNAFDRQYTRFTTPPEVEMDLLNAAEKAVHPTVLALHQQRVDTLTRVAGVLARTLRTV